MEPDPLPRPGPGPGQGAAQLPLPRRRPRRDHGRGGDGPGAEGHVLGAARKGPEHPAACRGPSSAPCGLATVHVDVPGGGSGRSSGTDRRRGGPSWWGSWPHAAAAPGNGVGRVPGCTLERSTATGTATGPDDGGTRPDTGVQATAPGPVAVADSATPPGWFADPARRHQVALLERAGVDRERLRRRRRRRRPALSRRLRRSFPCGTTPTGDRAWTRATGRTPRGACRRSARTRRALRPIHHHRLRRRRRRVRR